MQLPAGKALVNKVRSWVIEWPRCSCEVYCVCEWGVLRFVSCAFLLCGHFVHDTGFLCTWAKQCDHRAAQCVFFFFSYCVFKCLFPPSLFFCPIEIKISKMLLLKTKNEQNYCWLMSALFMVYISLDIPVVCSSVLNKRKSRWLWMNKSNMADQRM